MGISQVARHAAVSPATVSRVLNDDPRVGADLRARVVRAVRELDYRPNGLARNLRRQRTGTIGMLVADIENPYFGTMVRAVEDLAYGEGYRVLVCNTDERPDKQRAYLLALEEERALGVIISPSDASGPEIARLLDQGTPVVAYDRHVADPRGDAVLPDNLAGGRLATELLVADGHRDVAFVAGPQTVETGAARLAGYGIAMRAAGLAEQVVVGDFRVEGGRRAVEELLRAPVRPTAVVVSNSQMTIGALQVMRSAGLRAPDDLALVVVGDPPWAELTDPPLTAMAQPVRRIAADAMELLLQRVRGERVDARRIVHPFEVRRRGSTGPRSDAGR